MTRDSTRLARSALDTRLRPIRAAIVPTPPRGWIRAVREALAMSRSDLGGRLEVSRQAVEQLEASEAGGTIRLDSLRRAAEALDCELFYALVPRRSLAETVDARVRDVALRNVLAARQTMLLEDQLAGVDDEERLVDELADAVTGSLRRIWRDG